MNETISSLQDILIIAISLGISIGIPIGIVFLICIATDRKNKNDNL